MGSTVQAAKYFKGLISMFNPDYAIGKFAESAAL